MYSMMRSACETAGFLPRIRQFVPDSAALVALVAADMGIALVPASLRHLNINDATFRPLRRPQISVALALAYPKAEISPLVRQFLETARTVIRSGRASPATPESVGDADRFSIELQLAAGGPWPKGLALPHVADRGPDQQAERQLGHGLPMPDAGGVLDGGRVGDGDQHERGGDPVVEPALDIEQPPDPGRERWVDHHVRAEGGIGQCQCQCQCQRRVAAPGLRLTCQVMGTRQRGLRVKKMRGREDAWEMTLAPDAGTRQSREARL
jgi:hypothetical protein